MWWLLLLSSICVDLSHAPSSELSFAIESVGFSSGGKTEKRLVVSIKFLRWSFNVDVLAGFLRYSQQSLGTDFVTLSGFPVFSDLEVVV